MIPVKQYLLVAALLACLQLSAFSADKTSLSSLRCEYLPNPLGVDVTHPRLSWKIESSEGNFLQEAYEIRVSTQPISQGTRSERVWSTGKVNSSQSVNVVYNGTELRSGIRYSWQVRIWDSKGKATSWSKPAWWEMALLLPELWKAEWIAAPGQQPEDHRPVCFRKEFNLNKKIASARLRISSLGLYQLLLNGKKVGTDLFTPGWTSYNKRIQYQTYDITSLLSRQNTLATTVGDGWFRGNIGGKVKQNYYGNQTSLIAQVEIAFTDGSEQIVSSDDSWLTGSGPILSSDIYNGELYDATHELIGWDRPGFSSSSFVPAQVISHPKNILVASASYPVKAIEELTPRKIIHTPAGETVFDMGQNMVGWVRLKVTGKQGDRVVMKFAEVLDKSGNFYTENLRAAKATDVYILKGGTEETFEPHFTFHGFRYVKLEQFPGNPNLGTATGIVIHSAMPQTGWFSCSDSLINRLQQNIQWGQRGNFLDVPTDCPQRDERLGWTGDAQVFAPTAAFNFGVAPFFTKWLSDLTADQLLGGKVTDVVPDVRSGRGGSAAWGDASVVIPWTVYQAYGDTRILENQYPGMKAWVEYMRKRAGDDFLWTEDDHYGDWLAFASDQSDYPGATTEKDLIATAYYFHSTALLAQTAKILGKDAEAVSYQELAEKIRKAFQQEYIASSGRMVSGTQTAYALALSFGLVPESQVAKVASYLASDVQKMEQLTTGFVGTPLLCRALSDNGLDSLAFMLLMRKEYPSWLYPVTQGATTIWERWDGQKPDGTFQDVSMNSFNHYAYGAIGNWLYTYVAGIMGDTNTPGYKHFFLQPHPGGGLTSASAKLETPYGGIRSEWNIKNGKLQYRCSIPPNTTGTICFEHAEAKNILLNELPLENNPAIHCSKSNGNVKIEAGSGEYKFTVTGIFN